MTAVVLALRAAALWGTGDFLGGLATRRAERADRALLVAARRPARSRRLDRRQRRGAPGRACCCGPSARVSPERSGSAVSTAGWRSARWGSWRRSRPRRRSCRSRSASSRGDAPTAVQWVGIAFALAGIVLVSREPGRSAAPRVADGVGLALVAALGFGLFLVGLGEAAQESAPWAIATARSAPSLALLLALAVDADGARVCHGGSSLRSCSPSASSTRAPTCSSRSRRRTARSASWRFSARSIRSIDDPARPGGPARAARPDARPPVGWCGARRRGADRRRLRPCVG